MDAVTVIAERRALLARTETLIREFHPDLPAGAVIGAVTRCRADLLRAGVRRGLARATEARVRARLGGPPRPWADAPRWSRQPHPDRAARRGKS